MEQSAATGMSGGDAGSGGELCLPPGLEITALTRMCFSSPEGGELLTAASLALPFRFLSTTALFCSCLLITEGRIAAI